MHNVVDFIPERDRELYRRYREALRSKETRSHQEAIDMAISASGQLLSRSVDSADERKMLDEFLDKLEEKA